MIETDMAKKQSTFSEKLRQAVERDGRPKTRVADAAGLTPQTLQNYLSGTEPRPDVAVRLARTLGVDPVWLCDDEQPAAVDAPPRAGSSLSNSELTAEMARRLVSASRDIRQLLDEAEACDWWGLAESMVSAGVEGAGTTIGKLAQVVHADALLQAITVELNPVAWIYNHQDELLTEGEDVEQLLAPALSRRVVEIEKSNRRAFEWVREIMRARSVATIFKDRKPRVEAVFDVYRDMIAKQEEPPDLEDPYFLGDPAHSSNVIAREQIRQSRARRQKHSK